MVLSSASRRGNEYMSSEPPNRMSCTEPRGSRSMRKSFILASSSRLPVECHRSGPWEISSRVLVDRSFATAGALVSALDGVAQEPGKLLESRRVAFIGLDEIIVRLDHQVGGLVLVQRMRGMGEIGVRQRAAIGLRRERQRVRVYDEETVQAERLQQIQIMRADVDDVNSGDAPGLPQSQPDARQHTEKRAVHALALSEIHNKFLASLVDFLQRKLAQRLAVLERPASYDANVDPLTHTANGDSF